jgi:hypothetical protein
MMRPAIEMADIVRRKGKQFLERFKAVLNYQQLKAYRAVKRCRTAALGGHKDKCEECPYEAPFSYNSCLMGSNFLWRVRQQERLQPRVPGLWNSPLNFDLLHRDMFVQQRGIRSF